MSERAAVRDPSLPKPRQTVCGGAGEMGHLRRCRGKACARWLRCEVVATRLLQSVDQPGGAKDSSGIDRERGEPTGNSAVPHVHRLRCHEHRVVLAIRS
jgi:hypothetical protein